MMHLFDFHVHSWYSPDAADAPEALIAAAKSKGLSGLAITDHDRIGAHDYLLQQGLERPDGLPVDGFLVVPGVEVSTAEGHLLCLGVRLPVRKGRPAAEVVAEVQALGGIAIPAHPFDGWRAGIRPPALDRLAVKHLEVFNAAVTSRSYNAEARKYAQRRGLIGLAGSDAHHASAVGTATTGLELTDLSLAGVLRALEAGAISIEENYLSRAEGLKKHFGNWFRFGNASPGRPPVVPVS
jgi:predicted metal-dependent phosphoesterase TrpH